MIAVHNPEYNQCPCDACRMNALIGVYLIALMEPTDRALRLAGDVYPPDGNLGKKISEPFETYV